MEIQTACGCSIPYTLEDLDKQMETKGEWFKAKIMEHVLRVHRNSQKPMTSKELEALEEATRL